MLVCRDSRECRNMLGSDDYECHGRRDTYRDRWDVCVPD